MNSDTAIYNALLYAVGGAVSLCGTSELFIKALSDQGYVVVEKAELERLRAMLHAARFATFLAKPIFTKSPHLTK